MNGLPVATLVPGALPASRADRLAELFMAHRERLYILARRLAPTADDALDLVQETFLRAARAPASVPAITSEQEAWLVRVLINISRDQWRRAAVRRRHSEQVSRGASSSRNNAESELVARATVWAALDELAPRRRAVIVLHELEGVAVSDIARLLHIAQVTVRWHLSRGRRELERVLGARIGATNDES